MTLAPARPSTRGKAEARPAPPVGTQMGTRASGFYRHDLDGLRGVAIALVAIFHIWFGRVSGGVDVFLALSGFFFGGRLLASGSVYYLKWKNIQQSNYLPGCGFKYTSNLGNAESKGFDLQGEWLVTDALDLDFSLGYTDAHFTTNAATGQDSSVGPSTVPALNTLMLAIPIPLRS